jgi:hypothetical protein
MEAPESASPARMEGRPRSAPGRGKTSVLRTRVTDLERERFQVKSAELGETPARVYRRLIREFVSGGPDYFGRELTMLRQGCDQLARTGNNLNQMVKLAHQGECPLPSDVTAVLETMMGVVEEMHAALAGSVRRVVERRV